MLMMSVFSLFSLLFVENLLNWKIKQLVSLPRYIWARFNCGTLFSLPLTHTLSLSLFVFCVPVFFLFLSLALSMNRMLWIKNAGYYLNISYCWCWFVYTVQCTLYNKCYTVRQESISINNINLIDRGRDRERENEKKRTIWKSNTNENRNANRIHILNCNHQFGILVIREHKTGSKYNPTLFVLSIFFSSLLKNGEKK